MSSSGSSISRVAQCGLETVLKTVTPSETVRVRLLCPPPIIGWPARVDPNIGASTQWDESEVVTLVPFG